MTAARKPCPRCGGAKEPGKRRYCEACREALLPIWQRRDYERSRERSQNLVALRAAEGRSRVKRAGPDDTLRCGGCGEFLPKTSFATAGAGKWNAYCRPCYSHYSHDRRLRTTYGIDADEYAQILKIQDGRCAICLKRPRKVRLAVDHDHRTQAVRGLLCSRCNHKLLGGANDSAIMLQRAASYLEAPPAITRESPDTLPGWWERRLEQALENAEEDHVLDPSTPPVAMIKVPGSGQTVAAMSGATFLGLLAEYEKRVGVPLSITVH